VKKRAILIIAIAAASLVADQATKIWARSQLKGAPAIVLADDYLKLEYHENPGAAFGFLREVPGARYILLGIGAIALVLVWTMIRKLGQQRVLGDVAYGIVVGGALGNLIDRVYIGRVVDFIVMHWQHKFVWPAYNVADALLVAGVVLLVLVLGRKPPESKGQAKPKRKKGSRERG